MKADTIALPRTVCYPGVCANAIPEVCETPNPMRWVRASEPRPWMRYWARSLDEVLAGLAFGLGAGMLGVHYEPNFAFGLLALALWITLEAALVSSCGTTAGKWLFNIHLSKADGSLLTFHEALGRAVAVRIRGLGFGLPMVTVFTQIAAYRRLTRSGATAWDQQYGVVVVHKPVGVGRVLAIILTVITLFYLIGLGNAMTDPAATTAPAPQIQAAGYSVSS
jgi:hypothetical protein